MGSGAQRQFWQTFGTIKRDAIYINRCHAKTENIDRALNIFLALASSSSIGAWLIWKDVWPLWTGIIALSQALTAAKPLLPYRTRLQALSTLGPELDGIAHAAEVEWFGVGHGWLDDQQIHKLSMSLKKKAMTAQNKAFKAHHLPKDEKALKVAKAEALTYMAGMPAYDEDEDPEAVAGDAAADDPADGLGHENQE